MRPVAYALAAPLSFALFASLAALEDPSFSLGASYLSALGQGPGARLFLAATLLSAASTALLLRSLLPYWTSAWHRLGLSLFAVAAAALAGLGLVPTGPLHTFFAASFFLSTALALVSLSVAWLKQRTSWALSTYTRAVALATLALLAIGLPPLAQLLAVALIGSWFLALAAYLWRLPRDAGSGSRLTKK